MNQKDKELFDALALNPLPGVRWAIHAGADVNARTEYNETPLHWAAQNGFTDCVRVLIDNGADVNARDELQRTPLLIASRAGWVEVVRLLIEYGADIKAKDATGRTPLDHAGALKTTATAELLRDAAKPASHADRVTERRDDDENRQR
jgi:ankyrin repeat protein